MPSDRSAVRAGPSALAGLLLAGVLVASGPGAAKVHPTDPAALKATGEPRPCIPHRANISTRPAGTGTLMFREGANRWFRNDLRDSCPALRHDRVLIFRSMASQYCEMDLIDIVDPVSGMNFGACALGPFTPVEVPRGTRF